jgi:hypothetical protein
VEPDLALVSVLAYRSVAIWLPAPIGLVALSGLRKTVARWGRESEAIAADSVATEQATGAGESAAVDRTRPPALPIVAPTVPARMRRHEPAVSLAA